MFRSMFAVLSVLALTFITTGCQMSGSAGTTAASPQQAIMVSGGQGGGTAIFLPSSGPDKVVMLSTSGDAKECPQCKADAEKYFETGVLVPKCSMCGATRTVLTLPPTNVGHQ